MGEQPGRLMELAQRVQALAQTGLHFAKERYDIDRYKELLDIAAELSTLEFPERRDEVRAAFAQQTGYATPKVDVRGIVLRNGKVLLAREAEDGLWSLPGGWADVGDLPSAAIEREVREETGLEVRAVRLLGVWDRNLHGHPPFPFHVYKLIFLCEEVGGSLTPSVESLELGFFDPAELPRLSLTRVVPEQIVSSVNAALSTSSAPYFD